MLSRAVQLLVALLLSAPAINAPDVIVGTAHFRIWVQGDSVWAEPLLTPRFKLSVLAGKKLDPSTIVSCKVIARQVGINADEHIQVSVTVLRCGENEFGVAEVYFQDEQPAK